MFTTDQRSLEQGIYTLLTFLINIKNFLLTFFTTTFQEKLWKGVREGLIDMVVSDHSPCTQDLKTWNFMTAWGGVSSVQFTLSTLWTELRQRNFTLMDLSRLISKKPAELCRIDNKKGSLKVGLDADFVVWDPEETITVICIQTFFLQK